MRFRFFTIPAFDPDAAQDALNAFCAQHRIVASDRHFVDRGVDSFWAVCVTWVEGSAAALPAQGKRRRQPRAARRVVEQQRPALPRCQPQQERAWQPQPHHWLPPCPSSKAGDSAFDQTIIQPAAPPRAVAKTQGHPARE